MVSGLRSRLMSALVLLALVFGAQGLAAVPVATLGNGEAFIGTSVTVPASFINSGAEVGYGPYLDVIVPNGSPLAFTGASYLGANLEPEATRTVREDGTIDHPYHGAVDGLNPGDTVIILELPFGSIIPGQPTIDVDLEFDLSPAASIAEVHELGVFGGFRFGMDALDNPPLDENDVDGDPPLRQSSPNHGNVSPQLIEVNKSVLAPDHDTPIGPTFRHTYEITVDIAPGQTISGLQVVDSLPTSVVYLASSISVTGPDGDLGFVAGFEHDGGTCAGEPIDTGVDIGPCDGTNLVITVDGNVTIDETATAPGRVTFRFDFYIDLLDAHDNHTGSREDDQGYNTATVDGTWQRDGASLSGRTPALDLSDFDQLTLINDNEKHDEFSNGTIRLQKWVGSAGESSATAAIMDNVTFILDFQVSDPSVFGDVVIIDVLPDGLEFNEGSAELTVWRHGTEIVNGAPITPVVATTTEQTLTFDVTAQVGGGLLIGACVPPDGGEPDCEEVAASQSLRGQITYTAEVLRNYRNTAFGSVVQNDELVNEATVTGKIHGPGSDFPVTEFTDTDGDEATVRIKSALASKRIHAINDELRDPDATGVPMITAGDVVTFALRLDLGELSFKDLVLEDFLPLPVFDILSDGPVGFIASPTGDWDTPDAYTAWFGPGTADRVTDAGGIPLAQVSASMVAATNKVQIDLGSYTHLTDSSAAAAIEIMLAVPVVDAQLADGLYVTNLLRVTERNTATTEAIDQNIVQLQYTRPVLNISNGVINITGDSSLPPAGYLPVSLPDPVTSQAVNGPGGEGDRLEQFNRNEEGLDARDLVTYLVIVENEGLGRKGAWDVRLREALPPELPYGAIQRDTPLEIRRGDGLLLATISSDEDWEALFGQGGSAGYTIANPVVDGETTAVLGRAYLESHPETRVDDGTNLLYFTYQAELPADAEIHTEFTTISHVPHYTAQANGRNLTGPGLVTDNVYVTIIGPDPVKSIVATSEPHTDSEEVSTPLAIGEIIRYRLAVTIPEGQATNMVITDALPGGLQYLPGNTRIAYVVEPDASIAFGPTSIVGVPRYADAAAVPALLNGDSGDSFLLPDAMVTSTSPLTFSLGNVINGASDAQREQIIIEFNALVLDSSANSGAAEVGDAARTKSNRFTVTAGVGDTRAGQTSNTVTAQVEEPALTVSKEHDDLDNVVDAGATVQYTIEITNTGGATAFDLKLEDELPPHVTRVADSEVLTPTSAAWAFADDGAPGEMTGKGTYIVTAGSLPAGETITLTFDVTLDSTVPSNTDVTNTARLTEASSLPGDGTDHEENPTGNPTGANTPEQDDATCADCGERDYATEGSATFTTLAIALEKEVVATSEVATEGTDVAIGEVVRYRVIAQIPEGVNAGFTLTDALPAGLSYVDVGGTDDQVRFALVGNDLEASNDFLPEANNPGDAETCLIEELSLVALAPGQTVFATPVGNTLTFNLGDLTNDARDDSPACVVIEYNAFVNGTASHSAASQTNTVTGAANGEPMDEAEATVTVVEPNLQVTKAVTGVDPADWAIIEEGNASNVDGIDLVTFSVTVGNPTAADRDVSALYDVVFEDELESSYTFESGEYLLPGASDPVTFSLTADVISLELGSLEPGEEVRITYTVSVATGLIAGSEIDNVAGATGYSLDPDVEPSENTTGSVPGDPKEYDDDDTAQVTLAEPELSLAKALTSGPETGLGDEDDPVFDRRYGMTFTFIADNDGDIPLAGVMIQDDLHAAFTAAGRPDVTIQEATVSSVIRFDTTDGAPADCDDVDEDDCLTDYHANGDYNNTVTGGDREVDLLAPGVYLGVGQSVIVTLDVTVQLPEIVVDDEADEETWNPLVGSYTNLATASGSTPGGIEAEDDTDSTEITFAEIVDVSVTKNHPEISANEDGTFSVTYMIEIENTGEVPLLGLSLEDDLDGLYGAGTYDVADPASRIRDVTTSHGEPEAANSAVVLNAGYNGITVTELLDATSWLSPGESQTILISLTASPEFTDEDYENTAEVSGNSPVGQPAEDDSTVEHTFEADPEIAVALCLPAGGFVESSTTRGLFEVTLEVRVWNVGDIQLLDTQAHLDLAAALPSPAHISDLVITSDDLPVNEDYDGDTVTGLLADETILYTAYQAGLDEGLREFGLITVTFSLVTAGDTSFLVAATAQGRSPIVTGPDDDGIVNADSINDCFVDGTPPGDDDEPGPTPVADDQDPIIGVAKAFTDLRAVEGERGTFEIDFTFVLRNYGNVPLTGVTLFDDFEAAEMFGDQDEWEVTTITVPDGSPLTAADAATWSLGDSLLDPDESQLGTAAQAQLSDELDAFLPDTGEVTVTLRVTPEDPGKEYFNQAAGGGTPPDRDGSTPPPVDDESQDGPDPDPDGDEDPTNNDDPTPFTFETPIIGVSKVAPATFDFGSGAVENPYNVGNGDYLVGYIFTIVNYGDVELSDLTLTDPLLDQLDEGNPVTVTAVDGSLLANPAYDGNADLNILMPDQSLSFDEDAYLAGDFLATAETVGVIVTLRPGAALNSGVLVLENEAVAAGISPGGEEVTDDSNEGTNPDVGQPNEDNPDFDGDEDPTNNDGPTTIVLNESPVIALAKRLASFENLGDGDYRVDFVFTIENQGDVLLTGVQLEDDLVAAFRDSPLSIIELTAEPPLAAATDLATALTSGDLLDASNSTLAVGESATVSLALIVTPGERILDGPFENTALASGTSPGRNTVTDTSNDGDEPEAGEDVPTIIDLTEEPMIGVAKEAAVTALGDGTYDVEFTFVITNYGNVEVRRLQLSDDLAATFGAGTTLPQSIYSPTLTVHAVAPDPDVATAYDGETHTGLLLGTDVLGVGQSASVMLSVRVDPAALGTYLNTATVDGNSPSGTPVTDDSQNGPDPDPDGDDDPTNNDDPTPVVFAEDPQIALAKSAAVTTNADGTFDVALTFTVRNTGDVPLQSVQISDPLDDIYANTTLTPDSIVSLGGDLSYNIAFDGQTDANLLRGTDTLAVDAQKSISIRLAGISPTGLTSMTNTALATGSSRHGTPVEDRSNDGFDPEPEEDVPTPIELTEVPQIALSKRASLVMLDDESFTVTFTLNVANTGNTPLIGVQVADDLAEYYSLTDLTPAGISTASSTLSLNAGYDGRADGELLTGLDTLAIGESANLTVTLAGISVTGAETVIANSALATGSSPSGTPTEDRSNDGPEPEPGTDVPTLVDLREDPLLGVAKAASVTVATDGTFDVTFDFILRNYGNVPLTNLSLTDDLADFYSDAGLSSTNVSVSSADLPVNAAFNGQSDTELLGAGASLDIGESGSVTVALTGMRVSTRTHFENQADGTGTGPGGTPTPPEKSTDGPDPDPNGDGVPDEEVPTPVVLEPRPLLGTAKLARVSVNADASYRIEIDIRLVNMGNTPLSDMQVEDELTEFYTHTDLTPDAVSVASATLPANPAYDGQSVTHALLTGGTLAVGADAVVTITLDPVNPITQTHFTNSALGSGTPPGGPPVTDRSTDGPDPDPNDDGIPDEEVPTPIVLEPRGAIGVAKKADVSANDDGTFDVNFTFTVGNYGNTVLNNIQLRDDLTALYAVTDLAASHITVSSADFTVNNGFDGRGDPRLLTPTGNSLGLGESGTVTLVLAGLSPTEEVDVLNTAIGTADDPTGRPVLPDRSTDGDDPDPDGDGDPGNNNTPTPVRIGGEALIGLAKTASTTMLDGGAFDVVFTLLLRNYGDTAVHNLSITDPLDQFYANTDLTPAMVSVSSGVYEVNASYDGRDDIELLAPGNMLAVGQDVTVTVTLSGVTPNEGVTRLDNQAFAAGTTPDGREVTDTSQNGKDPDPDGSGPQYHSEPTPINFAELTATLIDKHAAPGPYTIGDRVSYTVTLANPNDIALVINLTDHTPPATQYVDGTAAFTPEARTPAAGSEPRQDEAGQLAWRTVVLPAGEQVSVTYDLRILPGAADPLTNTVIAEGESTDGAGVRAEATARVHLEEGVFDLSTSTLIGRVYLDVDGNSTYTEGVDVPLAGARVILSNGWQALTDEQGNYAFRELESGTWTVQVDRVTAPYTPAPHPEMLRDPRQHIVRVQGVTVSDFPFEALTGLTDQRRETTVSYGPITIHKYLVYLPDAVRVVFEVDSDAPQPPILITDPVPGGDAHVFEVHPTGEPQVITHDLPLGSQLTDPDVEWSVQ